jgi:hypothetical protein
MRRAAKNKALNGGEKMKGIKLVKLSVILMLIAVIFSSGYQSAFASSE